jgi:hypothetical protein
MREGRWASRVRGSKGARGLGRGQRTRGRGRVHDGEIVGGRLETTERWGRRVKERERARGEKNGADSSGPRGRERGRGRAQACTDRRGPPIRHRGRAGAVARVGWAKWANLG